MINSTQQKNPYQTCLIMNSQRKKGALKLVSNQIFGYTSNNIFEIIDKKFKIKCKQNIHQQIEKDFQHKSLNHSWLSQQNQYILLKVTMINHSKDNNKAQKRIKKSVQIIEIECENKDHSFYLLTLIRSEWQKRLNNQYEEHLLLEQILQLSQFYTHQNSVEIQDLIEIFEAPLTRQYSRL